MRNHQYLELMGIDVWRRRPPSGVSDPEGETPTTTGSDAAPHRATTVEAGASSIELVRQSLAQPAPDPAPTAPAPAPDDSTYAAIESVEDTSSTEDGAGPSFLMVFANFPEFSVASHYSADLAAVPDNHRRLLASLYFALTRQKAEPTLFEFRWPMVKSRHIPQSKADAAAVMQQSVSRLQTDVLVFGEEAFALFEVEDGEAYQQVESGGKRFSLLPELESFFSSPSDRRRLWQGLADLRGRVQRE